MDVITNNFVNNILAGVVGSIMTWVFISISRKIYYKRLFSKFEGSYSHHSPETGDRKGEDVTTIKYLKDNIILTKCKSPHGDWEGRILLNKENPDIGSGVYQYLNRDDCGVHQIQRDPKADKIFVHLTNTSHGKDFTMSYVWKRIKNQVI